MKFKKYLKQLKKLAKEHPETLKMTVISAADDEGNGYRGIYYGPTLGNFNENEMEFNTPDDEEYWEECEFTDKDINAICIN